MFKKEKDLKKGIAFPTCLSINNCVCHYSPLRSEAQDVMLNDGDVVKVDLGAHIDGFIATVAHTLVVGASKDMPVTDKRADAIVAAHNALEAAVRMLRPDRAQKNTDVTEMSSKIAEIYQCKPVENMLSFQLKRNQIGNEDDNESKQIILNPSDEQRQKIKRAEFKQHEVYAIDILVSTGEEKVALGTNRLKTTRETFVLPPRAGTSDTESLNEAQTRAYQMSVDLKNDLVGKGRELDTRTTVFKRNESVVYQLKMKASRGFFSEAEKRCGVMPFTLRAFDDERQAKMGIVECERHELMKAFKVYYEREGEFVAQFKSTVLIMPSGLLKITGLPFESDLYQSKYRIEDRELQLLIQSSLKQAKKKAADKPNDENAKPKEADKTKCAGPIKNNEKSQGKTPVKTK